MSKHATLHATFTIERIFAASPEKLFKAFSTVEEKSKWFAGPPMWRQKDRQFDFRVGGREVLKNEMDTGVVTSFNAEYFDIVPNDRIVYTYEMHLNDKKISVSLATIELKPEGDGTKLTLTEQGVFLDGYDEPGTREEGTKHLLDALEASLT